LLLGTDNDGRTAWHLAPERGHSDLLHKIWEWAEEKLTAEEMNNKLLLGTDNKGGNVWYVAELWSNIETFQKYWAKGILTIE
jgi:quinol monooxygenase YgiN